ncbi:unnamed protein product [Acanthoscelides obtectus]|uniref:Uncharacterized protein n=1 Tax=Acanthoscelides obtectus TaxID=200917 RepID=A0A9P0KQ25_ACAOB|nr:unnamed protein product [Acanthoscelides obtectus]CAK1654709.1 hypothetical protein AOBTE_LOCUS18784 [Acanthoscelides obtectus]
MKSAIIGLFVLVAIALTFEESEARLVCTRRICDTVRCAKQKCTAKQVLVKKGGFCGCCDLCVTILKKGQKCPNLHIVGGGPPTVRCAKGLRCVEGICKKA